MKKKNLFRESKEQIMIGLLGLFVCFAFVFVSFTPNIFAQSNNRFDSLFQEADSNFIINPPVFKPSLDFGISTGLCEFENFETVFVIDSKEVLRFYEDSIIIYFKGRNIVITDDSLCNTLDKITKETFK